VTPTIALLGDVMLGRGVAERLADVPPEEVWAPEVRELCRSCDLVICNLECCISTRGEPTERVSQKPYFFRGPPEAVRSLEAIGVRAVGLANNHALDYEAEALADTLDLLGEAGIAAAGAGRCSTTWATRSTTMRSTRGCETTSACWPSGGQAIPRRSWGWSG
jgi:poly-gamma-glutamate synthesis protein (capsule biosynthesis protein)